MIEGGEQSWGGTVGRGQIFCCQRMQLRYFVVFFPFLKLISFQKLFFLLFRVPNNKKTIAHAASAHLTINSASISYSLYIYIFIFIFILESESSAEYLYPTPPETMNKK